MTRNPKIVLALFCLSTILFVGATVRAQETRVKWSGLVGKDGDFVFLMPEGYQALDNGESALGTNPTDVVKIQGERAFSRYINGVALIVEAYEGKASAIHSLFLKMMKLKSVKSGTLGDFRFDSFLNTYPEFTLERQHFFAKNTLYVLSAAYRGERGQIADDFFKSVRLIDTGNKVFAPNFPADTPKSLLTARVADIVIDQIPDSEEIVQAPDKKPIVVYQPRATTYFEFGRSNTGLVKLKALLSNTGKVVKVETVSTPNLSLARGVRESAQHMVFLPAEKNGKPVTSWHLLEAGFQVSTQF